MTTKKNFFIYNRKFVKSINRIRILENRDLKRGIRLNRNERVEDFPKSLLSDIFKKVKSYDLGKYHDQNLVYKKLAKFLNVSEKNILISSGADGSIKSIFEIFTRKNDKIAFLDPSYAMYKVYSDVFETKPVKIGYDHKNFKLDKKKLYLAIRSGIKILFIPNPNQPIEDNITEKEMFAICKACLQAKVLLVIDEAYFMFGLHSSKNLIKKFNNLIILRTFSKSFGLPSIRFGYILSNENLIKSMNSYRLSYESNFLSDTVIIYFLKNFKIIKKYIKEVIKGRNYFKKEMKKLKYDVIGNKSNFLLVNFKNIDLKRKIFSRLFRKKIYVKGNYDGFLSTCILVTCGPKKIMKKVVSAIKNRP